MPIITHFVKHIFSYPLYFKLWIPTEISIHKYIYQLQKYNFINKK